MLGTGARVPRRRAPFAAGGRPLLWSATCAALSSQLFSTLREWGGSAPRLDDAALWLGCDNLVELLLQWRKPRPTGNRGGKVHVLPFIVVTRLALQARQAIEQVADHPNQAIIAVRTLRPIVHGQHGRHGYGGYPLALFDEVWIIRGFEVAGRVVLKLVVVFDRQEFEPFRPLPLEERRQRLGRDPECCCDLITLTHLLHGDAVGNEGLLHFDAELLHHDGTGERGGGTRCIEVHDFASQVPHGVDLGPYEQVHLGRKQAEEVVDAPRRPGKFRLASEMVEHVTIHDRHVDTAQVEEIIDVVERPARDDGEDAHVVAVIENACQFGGKLQRRAFGTPSG